MIARALALSLTLLIGAAAVAAPDRDDRYLAGYIAAVVEQDFALEVTDVQVEGGVAIVTVGDLGHVSPERVAAAVARIEGVERAVVRVDGDGEPAADRGGYGAGPSAGVASAGIDVLPRHELFDPLLADPREPHFSAAYQWYIADDELTHVGSANFGETFALLGGGLGEARWELGLLGAVFSIFDLDSESSDLVNSDFWVGPTLSLRQGRWSSQLRLYHQSSHVGDEYLLRGGTDRVNLSYEGVDLLLSADLHPSIRVYGGGGVLLHTNPDLHPLSVQGGIELRSPIAFFDDLVRPVAAFDIQAREEDEWFGDVGVVTGIELANPRPFGLRVMVLGSYFRGNSPNGQFYERRIEYLGAGIHLFF